MRALRRSEVERKTGLKRSAIYKKMRAGEFPLPIGLGTKAVAWIEDEVDQWLEAAKQKRDGQLAHNDDDNGRLEATK